MSFLLPFVSYTLLSSTCSDVKDIYRELSCCSSYTPVSMKDNVCSHKGLALRNGGTVPP